MKLPFNWAAYTYLKFVVVKVFILYIEIYMYTCIHYISISKFVIQGALVNCRLIESIDEMRKHGCHDLGLKLPLFFEGFTSF